MVVPRFITQAMQGKPLTVYGDGTQTRSFCDVRDTVVALDLLASNRASAAKSSTSGTTARFPSATWRKWSFSEPAAPPPSNTSPYLEAYGEEFEDITHRRPASGKIIPR